MRGRAMLLGLWLAAGAAAGQPPPADPWGQLAADAASAGLETKRFGDLVERCRHATLSIDEARSIAEPVLDAGRRRLPTEPVLAKIDEGLAKHVDANRIARAAAVRTEMLERADKLLATGRGLDPRGRPGLLVSAALALESGVPETAVAGLLNHAEANRPGPLMAVIQGLETLHAQGFPDADALRLMQEALQRGLRPPGVAGAVDYALRRLRQGAPAETITLDAGSPAPRGGRHGNGRPARNR